MKTIDWGTVRNNQNNLERAAGSLQDMGADLTKAAEHYTVLAEELHHRDAYIESLEARLALLTQKQNAGVLFMPEIVVEKNVQFQRAASNTEHFYYVMHVRDGGEYPSEYRFSSADTGPRDEGFLLRLRDDLVSYFNA